MNSEANSGYAEQTEYQCSDLNHRALLMQKDYRIQFKKNQTGTDHYRIRDSTGIRFRQHIHSRKKKQKRRKQVCRTAKHPQTPNLTVEKLPTHDLEKSAQIHKAVNKTPDQYPQSKTISPPNRGYSIR